MSKIYEISTAVENGKPKVISGLVQEALAEGVNATDILSAMIGAMGVVGDKFSTGEIYVPEMLVAARAMQKGVEVLKPALGGDSAVSLGKCIIGTVQGDLHDIGKNLVSLMIESTGFEVIDLGVDVHTDKFLETLKANPDAKIVACSALLTTTMASMEETVKAIKALNMAGLKIMVGGAPISPDFAAQIGADAYTLDAGAAAVKAKELVSAVV